MENAMGMEGEEGAGVAPEDGVGGEPGDDQAQAMDGVGADDPNQYQQEEQEQMDMEGLAQQQPMMDQQQMM
jgi:hypothetical protein